MRRIILIAHNLRSCHNVGSLLRTAEGLGVERVYLSGYTPYPQHPGDERLPHIASKIDRRIHKTALGAEALVPWEHVGDVIALMRTLQMQQFAIVALEQAPAAMRLPDYQPPEKLALIVGREVEGIEAAVLTQVSTILEIPMYGRKESFNVVQAAAMTLYHCRFHG